MTSLTAHDVLSRRVLRVTGEMRRQALTKTEHLYDAYAVFEEEPVPAGTPRFLGLVSPRRLGCHPWRIFADLVPRPAASPISDDAPIRHFLDRFVDNGEDALPAVGPQGEYSGAVTLASVIEAILRRTSHLDELGARSAIWPGGIGDRSPDGAEQTGYDVHRPHSSVDLRVKLREAAMTLTLAEQHERRRVADELHDYLSQLLVVARQKLGEAKTVMQTVRGGELLSLVDRLLEKSTRYTDTLIGEFMPPAHESADLTEGLRDISKRMRRLGLEVTVIGEPGAGPLPQGYAQFLYRSVQSLLMNVLKHAGVRSATVSVSRIPGTMLQVVVADIGVGFFPQSLEAPFEAFCKFGLSTIRERAFCFGGEMRIESGPGRGTSVILLLPL